jgi:hypothetical protein
LEGTPRYLVIYEVADIGVLNSPAYLKRLNHPTPWTQKMMESYRGMTRGFCRITASFGLGTGTFAALVRFSPLPGRESSLRATLSETFSRLPARPGFAGAHLLETAAAPAMTKEQEIRGRDKTFDWAVLVTGYSVESAPSFLENAAALLRLNAGEPLLASYRLEYSLTERELTLHERL